jgi:hypothetical protein
MMWPGHRFALAFFGGVLVAWLAVMTFLMHRSALPPEATGTMLAVFEPTINQDKAFATIVAAGGNVVRKTSFDFIWVVASDQPGLAGRLRDNGALGAYRELPISPTIAGCFALADAKVAEAFQ